MNKLISNILIITLIATVLTSCFKDDVIIDQEYLSTYDRPINLDAPIAKGIFNAIDLFERLGDSLTDFISIEEDSLICIKYKDSIFSEWTDVVEFEGVDFSKSYDLTNLLKSTRIVQTFEERIKLNAEDNQRFDSMKIQESMLSINLDFPSGFTGVYTVEFPELTKDGTILKFEFDAAQPGANETQDLAKYTTIFSQNSSKDSSYITMLIKADVTSSGIPNGSPAVEISLSIDKLVPEYLFGYFGQSTIMDEDGEFIFGFFEDFKAVDLIEFYDIQMNISFDNYFGIPYTSILNEARVIRRESNEVLNLELGANNTFEVEPAIYSENVVPTFNEYLFNRDNSNIGDALNLWPDKMEYHMQVTTNPNGEVQQNFITQLNHISGNLDLIIPMWLRTSAYERSDTVHSFNLINDMDEEQIDMIKSAAMELTFQNGFPFEIKAQVFFADDNYTVVDQLFDGDNVQFLNSGIIDNEGKVTSSEETVVSIELTNEKLKSLKANQATRLILYTNAITANEGADFVKLYANYGIEFALKISIESNSLMK